MESGWHISPILGEGNIQGLSECFSCSCRGSSTADWEIEIFRTEFSVLGRLMVTFKTGFAIFCRVASACRIARISSFSPWMCIFFRTYKHPLCKFVFLHRGRFVYCPFLPDRFTFLPVPTSELLIGPFFVVAKAGQHLVFSSGCPLFSDLRRDFSRLFCAYTATIRFLPLPEAPPLQAAAGCCSERLLPKQFHFRKRFLRAVSAPAQWPCPDQEE